MTLGSVWLRGLLFASTLGALAVGCSSPTEVVDDDAAVDEGALASGPVRGDPVYYLGVNSRSRAHETAGLAAQTEVVPITGAPVNGVVQVDDRTYDLRTSAGVDAFLAGVEIAEAARPPLAELFRDTLESALDETAALVLLFRDLERSGRPLRRLALSGHSGGNAISGEGDADAVVFFAPLKHLAEAFPVTAGSVQHLIISACYAAENALTEKWRFDDYRAVFPRLTSIWAYKGPSPTIPGSTDHLKAWERGTRVGASTGTLDEARRAAGRFGGVNGPNVRVWTPTRILGS